MSKVMGHILLTTLASLFVLTFSANAAGQTATSGGKRNGGGGGWSILGPTQDVQFLEKDSAVIVKGHVLAVHEKGMKDTRASVSAGRTASVQVDSVLKGKIEDRVITIKCSWDSLPWNSYPFVIHPQRGEYALFFLNNERDGDYAFVNPMTALVPITSREIPVSVATRTTKGKIRAELFASLSDPDHNVSRTAFQQVDRLGKAQAIKDLHQVAVSNDQESQGLAYAGLIYLGDYSLLSRAIRFAETLTTNANVQYWKARTAMAFGAIGDNRITQAREAVGYKREVHCASRIKLPSDKSLQPLLYPLLSSQNVELRRGAAHALRGICEPSSASFMARALSDGDRNVQYDAMMGLAALEDFPPDRPAPATSIFNQSPARYLDAWKEWWEAAGKRKYSASPWFDRRS